jgi:putative phosphoribosyl transferase
MRTEPYADRDEAGRVLAAHLAAYTDSHNAVIVGLPRGGVPVAAQVSAALRLPLDVLVVRKLGLPGHDELAMGAIAGMGGAVEIVRNNPVLAQQQIADEVFVDVYRRERHELRERESRYRQGRAIVSMRGHVVILIDDGVATGSTMRAAVAVVHNQQPDRIVIAVPVAPRATYEALREEVDDVVCPWIPQPFLAVAQAYVDFAPPSEEQVQLALAMT